MTNRHYIGLELNPSYVTLAQTRLGLTPTIQEVLT